MRHTYRNPCAPLAALFAILAALLAGGASLVARQQPATDPNALEVIQIRPNFYVIAGDGSNIAVQLGTDGIVIVDTGTGEKAEAGHCRDSQVVHQGRFVT